MPLFNPPDNYIRITLTDSDFTFSGTLPASDINSVADNVFIYEEGNTSFLCCHLIFDTPGMLLTQIKFKLPQGTADNNFNGWIYEPFLPSSGDGKVAFGTAKVGTSQNGMFIDATTELTRESGEYYISINVMSGNYDRVIFNMTYQTVSNE